MCRLVSVLLISVITISCNGQDGKAPSESKGKAHHVGGPCEGCEAIYEYGNKNLTSVDTLPDFNEEGPKLKITGTIYHKDGKTPAKGVILYIYHTDQRGIYATRGGETGWGKRHGYIRGWIKTGDDGRYTFYTLRPGIYPNRSTPAHIHPTIKEPGINEYYIESYHFSDDPLLQKNEEDKLPRGGSGILVLQKENDILVGHRDIILGLNIPGYD